nr:hypothetical protein Iba_chr06dCG10290 [Ipomoea batatas]
MDLFRVHCVAFYVFFYHNPNFIGRHALLPLIGTMPPPLPPPFLSNLSSGPSPFLRCCRRRALHTSYPSPPATGKCFETERED